MQVSRYEQETIINYNAEEKQAEIYTCDPMVIRKLRKLIDREGSGYVLKSTDNDSITVTVPKKLISFRTPVISKMTEEQKQASRERMASIRQKKNNS